MYRETPEHSSGREANLGMALRGSGSTAQGRPVRRGNGLLQAGSTAVLQAAQAHEWIRAPMHRILPQAYRRGNDPSGTALRLRLCLRFSQRIPRWPSYTHPSHSCWSSGKPGAIREDRRVDLVPEDNGWGSLKERDPRFMDA